MSDFAVGSDVSASVRSATLTNRALVAFTSFLMFASSALLALHLRPAPAALLLAACVGAMVLIARAPSCDGLLDEPIQRNRLAVAVAFAAAIFLLGGQLHLLHTPLDWRIRDAVLGDLVTTGFPSAYDYKGVDYVTRAPLGMYMLPALVGRAFGLYAAHVALFAQNSLFLGAVFYLIATIGHGFRHVVVMVLLAGCSALGIVLVMVGEMPLTLGRLLYIGFDSWNPHFQYSASLVQFFWVPNHALPGWWLAMLLLLLARRQLDEATVAVSIGGALFWSPLAILPAALWIVLRIAANFRVSLTSARLWAVAAVAVGFIPVAAYMVIGAETIDHGLSSDREEFWLLYIVFILAAFVPVGYIALYRRYVPSADRGLLIFSLILLVALPLGRFGPANDLVMRGSISALTIVAFCFGSVLLDPARRRTFARYLGALVLGLCAPSAAVELTRAAVFQRYPISDCSLFEANAALAGEDAPSNYAVDRRTMPAWLMNSDGATHRPVDVRQCWPDFGYGVDPTFSPGVSGKTVPKADSR